MCQASSCLSADLLAVDTHAALVSRRPPFNLGNVVQKFFVLTHCHQLLGFVIVTNDGRRAEITIDLVLQARIKMSENKVNGPEDAEVSEMIKQLPQEKFYVITKYFQERFTVKVEAPSSWKIVKLVFFTET